MMNKPARTIEWLVWGGLGLIIAVIVGSFVVSKTKPGEPPPPVLGQIAGFMLTNQNDRAVSLADLRGHVWVADIIFTRCAGPCPRMTEQMKSLQDALPQTSAAKLVTLTTDPEFDTPPVMKKYGGRFGADSDRWMFLTGAKKEIAALAVDGLKLTVLPVKPEEQKDPADLFIHSTIFVVVDKRARLRGVFETGGDGVEWTNVQPALLNTVRQLEREP